MNFHLNLQRLISPVAVEAPSAAPAIRQPRDYMVTYSTGTNFKRIKIKAEGRLEAHDSAKANTPEGMTFTNLRELRNPSRTMRNCQ